MIVRSSFKPAWWLPGAHLQTLWPNLLRRTPYTPLYRERLELEDGDFIDLDWLELEPGELPAESEPAEPVSPTVLVLHGLEGSSESHYARALLRSLQHCGLRAVVMHFRGCSGEPNRLTRGYHSGETGDLATVIRHLQSQHPDSNLAAVGYSLGGNVLLKYLGERGQASGLCGAVAVSVPFLLDQAAWRMARGVSRIYQRHLLGLLRRSLREKYSRHALTPPLPLSRLRELHTFHQFDNAVTAPLHGFSDADDYYKQSSSRTYLRGIATPTLIIHAEDDPFMTPAVIPTAEELSDSVTLELSPHGGHVGFVGGSPLAPRYWLEDRIPAYLCQQLKHTTGQPTGEPALSADVS